MVSKYTWIALVAGAALLLGCGGGGGEPGGPATMTVVPPSFSLEYKLDESMTRENRSCEPQTDPTYLGVFEVFGGHSPVDVALIDESRFSLVQDPSQPRKFRLFHRGGCTSGAAVRVAEAGRVQVLTVNVNVTYEKVPSRQ